MKFLALICFAVSSLAYADISLVSDEGMNLNFNVETQVRSAHYRGNESQINGVYIRLLSAGRGESGYSNEIYISTRILVGNGMDPISFTKAVLANEIDLQVFTASNPIFSPQGAHRTRVYAINIGFKPKRSNASQCVVK